MKRLDLAGVGRRRRDEMGSANCADIDSPARRCWSRRRSMCRRQPDRRLCRHERRRRRAARTGATPSPPIPDTSGAVVGGTIGYNYQMGQTVFGLEGDGDWSNLRGTSTGGACTGTSCETHNSWLATARGRLGYAFGRFMPYVTGGAAFGDVKATAAGLGTRPPRDSAGPAAAVSKRRSPDRGARRSNISMSISARAIATPRPAALRPAPA